MKLIVISPETNLSLEKEIVHVLFNEGLQYFHLRKPLYSREEMKSYIKNCHADYYNRIVLHSHHSLADEYALGGIHYNNKEVLPTRLNETQRSLRISYSAHSLSDLLQIKIPLNYVFLSPVFDSISKQNYKANPEFSDLKKFQKTHTGLPKKIALGGISSENIEIAAEMGFVGVAVLGSLWQKGNSVPETVKNFRLIQKKCADTNA